MRDFNTDVYEVVAIIPPGRVLTYGMVASLAGWPAHARMVGRAMWAASEAGIPCHRVVNSSGRTAPNWPHQRRLLEAEGVTFRPNGTVDMRKHLWKVGDEA